MTPRHVLLSMLACLAVSAAAVSAALAWFPQLAEASGVDGLSPASAKTLVERAAPSDPVGRPPVIWESIGAGVAPGEMPATYLQPEPDWGAIGAPCPGDDPHVTAYCNAVPPSDSEQEPERLIYAVGNSHTALLSNALLEVVGRHPTWSMRSQAEPGCVFSFVPTPKSACERLWTIATAFIREHEPALVVVMGTRSGQPGQAENKLDGLDDWVRMIETTTSSQVVAVRDSPRFASDMAACEREHGGAEHACEHPAPSDDVSAHARELAAAGATWVDLSDRFCPHGTCPGAQGGILEYIDDNHPTASFWRSLAPFLSRAIHEDVAWWPEDPFDGEYENRTTEAAQPVI